MNRRRRNLIIVISPALIIPILLLAGNIYQIYIRKFILPCPVYTLFRIYCPGCGGTRAIYALLDGDFMLALRNNALYFSCFIMCLLFWLENLIALFGRDVKIIPRSGKFLLAASGIMLLYIILRNFIPFLAPI